MTETNSLILIVDDVPKNLQVLGNILRNQNYQIAAAMNGKQALALLENIRPALILLDVMMPEMDGFETCKRLKASEKTREIPVIFLTAKTETQDIVTGFETGAVDYVTKPFNATELLARVRTHIELKNARDRLKELVAKLQRANRQLRERQNLIVKLLGDVSKIRLSGDRHAIRNFAQKLYENEKNRIMAAVSAQIEMTGQLVRDHQPERLFLENACKPFGIEPGMQADRSAMEDTLHRIVVDEKTGGGDAAPNDPADDLFGAIFSADVYLDDAYAGFERAKKEYAGGNEILAEFDPFGVLFSLRSVQRIIAEINKRFSDHGTIGFLDRITLSEAVESAGRQASAEKERELEIGADIGYDPELHTNRDSLVYMIRDLFYNAIDAGAEKVEVKSARPSNEEHLPFFDSFVFDEYPSLYMRIADNSSGIPPEKAARLNAYLNGTDDDVTGLSTKGKEKGGLGTKNLRDFLYLHKGHCFYENAGRGTAVHLYFERLEI